MCIRDSNKHCQNIKNANILNKKMDAKPRRQLAAVMFADIVGYTTLMQSNEDEALFSLQKFKTNLHHLVPNHSGEIINFYGDGCLAIFQSSVEATICAEKLQQAFLNDPQVPVRMGLHAGDVVFRDDNVFGNAVNIASRLESISIPGAVLLSSNVRNQIKNIPGINFCLLYTSPSPRDATLSRMPSSA